MNDCIFCKIISGQINSLKVYEDEYVFAFKDIDAKAPIHILIVPKEHIESVNHLTDESALLISKIMLAAKKIAQDFNVDQSGYRLVTNTGKDAGQSVNHLHFHLLGARELSWPPG